MSTPTESPEHAPTPATSVPGFGNRFDVGTVLVLAASMAITVWVANLTHREDIAGAIGETFGRMLIPFLIAWAATRKSRDGSAARARFVAACVVLLLSATSGYNTWQKNASLKQAMHEVAAVSRLTDGSSARGPASSATSPSASAMPALPVAPPEAGSVAAYVSGVAAIAKKNALDQIDFGKQIDAVDLGMVLAPETLTNLQRIGVAHDRVATYRKAIDGSYARQEAYWKEAEAYLATAPVDAATRSAITAGYNRSATKTKAVYAEWVQTERKVLQAFDDMLDFAAARQGRMGVQDGQMAFAEHADTVKYIAMMQSMRDLSTAEEAANAKLEQLRAEQRARIAEGERQVQ